MVIVGNTRSEVEYMVKLSEMENDVLQKILEGKNSKIIAQELGIKYRSVQRAIERMKQKLMLNSTIENKKE